MRWQVADADFYSVSIYDILGRKVKSIRQERMDLGNYYEHVNKGLPSGIYFAVVDKHDDRRIVKFTVLR